MIPLATITLTTIFSTLTIVLCVLSMLCLLALHVTSPEFQPSWRMVSEYALGKHKWLLTSFFVLWAFGSLTATILLWGEVTRATALIGVILLFISSIGGLMGGLFDVNHKLHGMAAMLGVPTLPIAALLIAYNLGNTSSLVMLASHATWISLVLMAVSMIVMMNGFKKAGVPMGPNSPVPERVPDGVLAFAGYANRLLIICNLGWLISVAINFLNLGQKNI
jgi:Protein of unknown function (DUF998)